MLTKYENFLKVAAVGLLVVQASSHAAGKDYENFGLPNNGEKQVSPESRLNYDTGRLTLKGKNVRLREPSVNHQTYVFAKEAYISEKRDEAIKLVRQQLDTGFKSNRDNMLLRLGQLYAEKYMEVTYRENELFSYELEVFEKAKAQNKKMAQPRLDNTHSQSYLKDALQIFYSLEKEFPKHPKIDEVVFFIGFVELESGNGKKGEKYLERVVKSYPKSRKYDEAVVYLADYYFEKHKFKEAVAKYRILLSKKDSSLYDYAVYKLAWCELNTNEHARALKDMRSLVENLEGSNDKAKFNLREQAIKDLVIFFAEAGDVDDAMAFFTRVQSKEKAVENIRLIADILKSKARDLEALKAYKILLAENPNTVEAPRIELGLYDSLARIGKNKEAMSLLLGAIKKYGTQDGWEKNFEGEKLKEAKASQETLAVEAGKIAMFNHQAAQKSANKGHYDTAANIYNALLQNFPNHPDKKKLAFYLGEIYFSQGKWVESSDAYMQAAQVMPKDKVTDESVYNALLALDKLTAKSEKLERFSKEEQKTVSTEPQEISKGEQKFIEVAEYYLKEYPKGDRVVDVRFRIASIYYRYHHFDKSLEIFKDIALKNSSHRSATTAANIVLDIYNIKKDFETMNGTAQLFASTKGLGDDKFRAEMASITGEIGFKKIEGFEKDNQWSKAAEKYLEFYKANPNGSLAEKSLYNAYISYQKAEDEGKTAEMARLFISKFPKSEYTSRIMLAGAKSAEKMHDYDQAQKLYLDFYRKFPKDKEARKAHYNAAVFAELLELNGMALDLYQSYLKEGDVSKEEKRAIQVSLAKLYRRQNQWDKMAAVYRGLMKDAGNAEKLGFLGEMAFQYEKAGKMKDRDAILNEIRLHYKSVGQKNVGTGFGVQYAAEARFREIQKEREKYEKIVLRFPESDLTYLLKRKEKLLLKLAASYDEIVSIGVPEWGVAALFEKSQAYANFVKNYRSLQIPKQYKEEEKKDAEMALKAIDAKMVAPLESKTLEILKACSQRASEFHVTNEYAKGCNEKLADTGNRSDPSGLLPQPSYWSTRALTEGVARK